MSGRRWIRGIGLGVIAGVLTLVGVAACSSLSTPDLERGLLELPKNAPLAEIGVTHQRAMMLLDGVAMDGELRYVHVPGDSPDDTTPLVLIHGTPGSLFNWSELMFGQGQLAGWRDTWLIDVLGHGITPTHSEPCTFQSCADWIASALRALDLGPVDLVAHSYGGEFAWRMALDSPELVRRLVLIDSAGMPRNANEWLPEEEAMRDLPGAGFGWLLNDRSRISTALQPHFREPVTDDQLEEMFLLCENADNWSAMVDLARDENGERAPELADLQPPTLLIWGADDFAYTVERFARRFEELIPDVRLELIAQCGHYPHEERPAEVAALLRQFLAH
jgi:pimeloyl-ACP methyl ester carboxylesterase